MLAPFEPARIKIARANEHIQDLKSKIAKFFEQGGAYVAFELADEYTQATGMKTAAFTYRQEEPVPDVWSAIIGDAIHNMRTALDLVASDLHRITGGASKDTSGVHFPFCKEKGELSAMIRSRRLNHVGPEFIAIIEQTAPYKGGNDGLRAIHDLDRLDKHQAFVPTISVVQMDWPVPVIDKSKFTTGVANDGQRLIIFPHAFAHMLPIGARIRADFLIVFGEVGFFRGRDVVKQLEACLASISFIIDSFVRVADEKALLGPKSTDA